MFAILLLLTVVTVSILVTRVASTALTQTGLSSELARFQARSAFTGAGFTTSESEKVVNHPVRRRIVLALMLLGNAGIVTAASPLILTFVKEDDNGMPLAVKVVLLVCELLALWALAHSQWIDRRLVRIIDTILRKHAKLDTRDLTSLMRLSGAYSLVELQVQPGGWLAGRCLSEANLRDEGAFWSWGSTARTGRTSERRRGTPGSTPEIRCYSMVEAICSRNCTAVRGVPKATANTRMQYVTSSRSSRKRNAAKPRRKLGSNRSRPLRVSRGRL